MKRYTVICYPSKDGVRPTSFRFRTFAAAKKAEKFLLDIVGPGRVCIIYDYEIQKDDYLVSEGTG